MEIENCPVLLRTKTWQNLYGVRRGNFRAYRKFCKRRNKKIRKTLQVTFNRKFARDKFKSFYDNHELAAAMNEKQGLLAIESILLQAENHFCTFLESKSSASNVPKRLVKKQLRSSLKYVDCVLKHFHPFLSVRSKGEFGIYRSLVASSLFMERKLFKEAKEELVQVIAVLGKLMEVVTALEKAQMEELMESARQNLRYCKFQLKEFDRKEERDMAVIRDSNDVREMLEEVAKTAVVGMRSVSTFNKTLEIDDPQIIAVFGKEQVMRSGLVGLKSEVANEDLFWELANIYEDGCRLCHKKRTEAGNNQSLSNIWSNVESLFEFQKTLLLFRRNLRMFKNYDLRFEAGEAGLNWDRRPQESIKQLETLIVHNRILSDILTRFGLQCGFLPCFEKMLRGYKCMFICRFYNKSCCFKEGLSLAENQLAVLKEVEKSVAGGRPQLMDEIASYESTYGVGEHYSLIGLTDFLIGCLNRSVINLKVLSKQAKVGLFDEGQESMHKLNENLEELAIPSLNSNSKNINSLMDLVVENRESKAKDQMDFMKLPPIGTLIPNKPIFLDLVWNFIEYGEVPKQLAEEPKIAKKGLLGFFGLGK